MACIPKYPLVSIFGKIDLLKLHVSVGETHALLTRKAGTYCEVFSQRDNDASAKRMLPLGHF